MKSTMNRSNTIGGSDIAAIMGLSPWKTPMQLYNEKINNINQDKPVLQRGRKLEKYILEEYSDLTGYTLQTDKEVISKDYPFLVAHIDAIVPDQNIIVEAKSVGSSPSKWENTIPIYYKTQIAFYAYLTDCEQVDVAVLFDRWEFCRFSYFRDKEFETIIIESAVKFYENHLIKQVEPEPINIDDAKTRYNTPKLTSIEASKEIFNTLSNMRRAKDYIKSAEDSFYKMQASIMNYMQNNTLLEFEGFNVASWKEQNRSAFDVTEFKTVYPELYNKYLKTNSNRVFRFI